MIYRRYVDDRATDDLEQPPSLAHRGAWAVALLAAVALTATFLGDALSGDEEVTSATESRRADELRAQRFAADRGVDATEVVVVSSESGTVDDPRFARGVDGLATELRAAGAAQVTTFHDTGPQLISRDQDATAMLVALGRDAEDDVEGVVEAVRTADALAGFDAAITGEFTLDDDFSTLAEEDLANGELGFGLPAALIVLLIVFDPWLAASYRC